MPTLEDIHATLRAQMPYLRERYHVETLGVFGSYARSEQTDESDLDVLVTYSKTPGLFAFVGLAQYLEDLLGVKVDLATPAMLKARIQPGVYEDLVAV